MWMNIIRSHSPQKKRLLKAPMLTNLPNSHTRPNILASKSLGFAINDLHRSIRQLKAKSSSKHEKMSNKLSKMIPILHYGFILQTLNRSRLKNAYQDHRKLYRKTILLPKEKLHSSLSIGSHPSLFFLIG